MPAWTPRELAAARPRSRRLPWLRRWPAVAAGLLLLASCGSGSGSGGRAASPSTTGADGTGRTVVVPADAGTTPGTTAPGTASTPGDRYLTIIAPANQVVAAFNAATDAAVRIKALQALSIVLGLIAIQLESAVWPADAQVAVAQLVAATSSAKTSTDLLLSSPSSQATLAFTAAVAALSAASSKVRLALGLPPVAGG